MNRLRRAGLSVLIGGGMFVIVVGATTALSRSKTSMPLRVAAQVRSTDALPPGLLVAAGRVDGSRAAQLAAPALAPLMGSLAPVAVPSEDGQRLFYSTWKELRADDPSKSWLEQGIQAGEPLGRPSVRVYDFASKSDGLVADGAYSVAVRGDGALAYVKGTNPDYSAGEAFVGGVIVRQPGSANEEVWSTAPGEYVVTAWAQQTLLAYRIGEGERMDLLALDGRGKERVLAADTFLVAVSPDGSEAFVADQPPATEVSVRVIAIASGATIARLPLELGSGGQIQFAVYSGSWQGDLVAVRTDAGLAIFKVSGSAISLHRLLVFDQGVFGRGVIEPQFDGGTDRVVAWSDLAAPPQKARDVAGPTVILDCSTQSGQCSRSVEAPAHDWLRFAYNPSRGKGGK